MISLVDLQRRIATGDLSAEAAMAQSLEAIGAQDKTIGAFVCRADNLHAASAGPLRGIAVGTNEGPAGVLTRVDSAMHTLRLNTMATAIIARMAPHPDGSGVEMTWANAGHPPPILVGPEGWAGQVLALDESQILLGLDSDADRTDSTLDLPAGTQHGALVGPDGVVCLEAHLEAGRLAAEPGHLPGWSTGASNQTDRAGTA